MSQQPISPPVVAPRRRTAPAVAPVPTLVPPTPPVVAARPPRPVTALPAPPSTPEPAPVSPAQGPTSKQKATRFKRPSVDDPHVVAPGRVTPPERLDLGGASDLADLSSACGVVDVDAAHRLDPYWDGLWSTGSGASWLSPDLAARQTEAGLGRLPKPLALDPDLALDRFTASRGWRDRLAMLGTVFSWRTVSAEQAAAIVGDARLAQATGPATAEAFASGLIDLGVFSNGLTNTTLTGRGGLYRPSKSSAFDDDLADRLTWAEWLSVTGGLPWSAGVTYDRHNLLATELGLRFAEYAEVGTVLGERFSGIDLLAGSGLGREPMVGDQRAADMTVVRPDGMRIAVEVTATSSSYFFDKVSRWARLLAERPFDTSGLCVVFVVTQHPESLGDEKGYRARARTYQAIAAATKEFPGTVRDRVAERIGVATWREWFPARGKVTDAFPAMRVDRPTGSGVHLWEPCDMLSPTSRPFTPADSFDATAILDNATMLGGTPHWLRDRRTAPPVWRRLLDEAGLDALPNPSPARPNRTKGRALGEGVGAAGAAKPPARLLGLG